MHYINYYLTSWGYNYITHCCLNHVQSPVYNVHPTRTHNSPFLCHFVRVKHILSRDHIVAFNLRLGFNYTVYILYNYYFISSAVPSGRGAFQMPTCASSSSTLRRGRAMKLLWYDINNIWWEGFYCIALKVIFIGRKVKIMPFLHIIPFSQKTGQ